MIPLYYSAEPTECTRKGNRDRLGVGRGGMGSLIVSKLKSISLTAVAKVARLQMLPDEQIWLNRNQVFPRERNSGWIFSALKRHVH